MPNDMTADDINDVLNEPGYTFECGERAEVETRRDFNKLAEVAGPDLMEKMLVQFCLPIEADIRAIPNHPAIPFLDAHHERKLLGA